MTYCKLKYCPNCYFKFDFWLEMFPLYINFFYRDRSHHDSTKTVGERTTDPHLPEIMANCVYWSSLEYAVCRDTDWTLVPACHNSDSPGRCPDKGWVMLGGPSSALTKCKTSRGEGIYCQCTRHSAVNRERKQWNLFTHSKVYST